MANEASDGVFPNRNFERKLYNVLEHGSVLDLQKLFEQGCPVSFYKDTWDLLHFAMMQSPEKVDLLFAAGWHIESVQSISELVLFGGSTSVDVYLDHIPCGPYAPFLGLSMLDDLFKRVPSTDKSRRNLLLRTVAQILSLNADIKRCTLDGLTAVHLSVVRQHFFATKFLCECGADHLQKSEWNAMPVFATCMTPREMVHFLFDLEENKDANEIESYLAGHEIVYHDYWSTPKRIVKTLKEQARSFLRKQFRRNVNNVLRATSMLRNEIDPIPAQLIDYLEFK